MGAAETTKKIEELKVLAETNPEQASFAISAIVNADKKTAQKIIDTGILQRLAEQNPMQASWAIEAIVKADKDTAQQIVDTDILQRIAEQYPEEARWAIVAIVEADKDTAASIVQKPELLAIIKDDEKAVNAVSEGIYNHAKDAEEKGELTEAGFEKTDKGFLSRQFGLAVGEKSPRSGCHSLLVADPSAGQEGRALVLAGCFNGTLHQFQLAIERTYSSADNRSRGHQHAVHRTMVKAANQLQLSA